MSAVRDLQTAWIQFDSATQLRNPLVATAARRFEPSHQKRDLAGRGCQVPRALDRRGRGVEVTEPQIRQPEVGPDGRLAGRELGRLHELLPGCIDQAHLQAGETTIEVPRRLLVGIGPRGRQAPSLARGHVRANRRRGREGERDGQDEEMAPGPAHHLMGVE